MLERIISHNMTNINVSVIQHNKHLHLQMCKLYCVKTKNLMQSLHKTSCAKNNKMAVTCTSQVDLY